MKKRILFLLLLIVPAIQVFSQRPVKLKNEADSLSYALGFLSGYRILDNYPGIEKSIVPETFQYAFQATLDGEMPFVDEYKTRNFVDEYYGEIKKQLWRENREAGERFLEQNRSRSGVIETSSGLQYEIVRKGEDDNERPRPYDDMVISVIGKTVDGKVFEDDDRNSTYPASLNDGLEEGTQLMSPGAKYIFYLPYNLAFGEDGDRKVSPYSTVIYEVTMISMTRDHSYYDEPEDAQINIEAWQSGSDVSDAQSESGTLQTRDAGDYTATTLLSKNLGVTVDDYRRDDIVKSYEVDGFKVVVTGDRTIVLDANNREVFRNTLDEETNSYDQYHLTEFRHKNGEGPIFLVLDMGFDYGSFFGSMVYKIENGKFSQIPEFLNLVTFNRSDDDEHYGRLSPVLDLYRENGQTSFHFSTAILSYNPAATEVLVPGEDFIYIYDGEKLVESGAATGLTFFRVRRLTEQFRQRHDYRIWHAEIGDIDGDRKDDLVVFVYENETIYVCQLDGDKIGQIAEYDLSYDYSINRESKVLRNGMITVERDSDEVKKQLSVYNGNLVERD